MAEKAKKSPQKSTGAKKKAPAAGKAKKTAAKKKNTGGRKSPLLVLVIMLLLIVIVLMAKNYYDSHDSKIIKDNSFVKSLKTGKKTEKRDESAPEKGASEKTKKVVSKKEETEKDTADEETAEVKKRTIRVYFIKMHPGSEKMDLTPVRREVDEERKVEKALYELTKGPSPWEKKKGYLSAVPEKLIIRSVSIKNGIADIDFNGAIEYSATGNILLSRLDQIVYTATQFPEVKAVRIRINGRSKSTLGADGISISGPLYRRE